MVVGGFFLRLQLFCLLLYPSAGLCDFRIDFYQVFDGHGFTVRKHWVFVNENLESSTGQQIIPASILNDIQHIAVQMVQLHRERLSQRSPPSGSSPMNSHHSSLSSPQPHSPVVQLWQLASAAMVELPQPPIVSCPYSPPAVEVVRQWPDDNNMQSSFSSDNSSLLYNQYRIRNLLAGVNSANTANYNVDTDTTEALFYINGNIEQYRVVITHCSSLNEAPLMY